MANSKVRPLTPAMSRGTLEAAHRTGVVVVQRLHVGRCINSVKMHAFLYAMKESGCADAGAVEILVLTGLTSSGKQMAQQLLNLKNQNQTLDGCSVVVQ